MYHFTRTATLTGSFRRRMAWAAEITGYVNANCPLPFAGWAAGFGQPLGTLVWDTMAESMAELDEAATALGGQDAYHDLEDAGLEFQGGPAQDRLATLLGGDLPAPPPVGTIATVTTATVANGRMVDATTWALEMAGYANGLTGAPVSLWLDTYGAMGQFSWITTAPDAAGVEAANAKLVLDPGYVDRLTATAELFLPGSGHVASYTRWA